MKKCMAMVISIVMLLSMAVAMPVSADAEEVNLIVNGSFEEVDQENALVGWTQINPSNPMIRYQNGTTEISGTAVSFATDGTHFVFNNTVAEGGAGLRQTVNLASDAAWVTNQAKYRFNLSFAYYWAYSTPWADVRITAYDADGLSYTKTYAGGTGWTLPEGFWTEATANIDISEVLDMSPAAIVKIDIELLTQNKDAGSGYANAYWDNVKLVPVYDADKTVSPMNLIKNGSFEIGDENGITGWSQVNAANPYGRYANGSMITEINADKAISVATDGSYYVANKYNETTGAGGLKQTVKLAAGTDWVANQGKYKFNLTFSYYFAYDKPWCSVKVTAYDADNNYSTKTYVGGTDFTAAATWAMNESVIDISPVIDSLESTAVKLDIELLTREEAWTYGYNFFDGVKLIPVYDETKTTSVNLIKNGTFEIVKANAAEHEIYGWTQAGGIDYNNRYFEQGTALLADYNSSTGGGWVYTTLPSTAAIYHVDASETSAWGQLEQTVTFDENADYYVNYGAYDFELSMDVHQFSTSYRGWLELTVTGEDGTTAKQTVNFTVNGSYATNSHTFNIKELVGATIGNQPIKSVKVALVGKGNNQVIAYDNVKLVPVKIADVAIVDGSGNEVTEITTAEGAAFTAKASYSGDDTAAYAYIAVYTKGANGILKLTAVNNALLTSGVESTSAALTGINTTAGTTVVKAFIWGSDANSLISVTAD